MRWWWLGGEYGGESPSQKATMPTTSSYAIRSCSVTSLREWTNRYPWGSQGLKLASHLPQKWTATTSWGASKRLPVPSKQRLGLGDPLVGQTLAAPYTPFLGGMSIGADHAGISRFPTWPTWPYSEIPAQQIWIGKRKVRFFLVASLAWNKHPQDRMLFLGSMDGRGVVTESALVSRNWLPGAATLDRMRLLLSRPRAVQQDQRGRKKQGHPFDPGMRGSERLRELSHQEP